MSLSCSRKAAQSIVFKNINGGAEEIRTRDLCIANAWREPTPVTPLYSACKPGRCSRLESGIYPA